MNATKDSFEPARVAQATRLSGDAPRVAESPPHSSDQLPNSTRVYVPGALHEDIRVPMREIALSPTRSFNGQSEVNEPVRVYDCSGPWGDPEFKNGVEEGLPPLRAEWIHARADVEEYGGRPVKPIDDGYLTEPHRGIVRARRQDETSLDLHGTALPKRKILRAKPGKVVTQLAYARAAIITPEMEFIAIRENMRGAHAPPVSADAPRIDDLSRDIFRNELNKQHAGSAQLSLNTDPLITDYSPSVCRRFPQRIPGEITPEFVRDEVAAGRAIIPANINHPESEPDRKSVV